MTRLQRVKLLRLRRNFLTWWECSNCINRTWFRMKHPILMAQVDQRVRLIRAGFGVLDA
jgi:hypothetical protein